MRVRVVCNLDSEAGVEQRGNGQSEGVVGRLVEDRERLMVQVSGGFGLKGVGFRIQGFRVYALGFRVHG